MDLQSAANLALATAKRRASQSHETDRLARQADTSHREVIATHPEALTAYRVSPVHAILHTASVGVYDRWIVTLKESTPGLIQLTMRDIEAQRDQQLIVEVRTEAELVAAIDAWYPKIEWWRNRLSMVRLVADKRYCVIRAFTDYYGGVFELGTVLTYVERHFLPYEGGNTIIFKEVRLYLQETENSQIISDFDTYFEQLELLPD